MSTYTNDENIRFLNDKNISQALEDDTARQTNTVPSLDLLNEVNNALTAYDDRLCAYIDGLNEEYQFDETSPYLSVITKIQQIKGQLTGIESVELLSSHVKNLREFVEDTIDSLDVATLSDTNKFVRTLAEIDGKIQATFTKVLSSDLEGQLQQAQIQNLITDLDSCYKKTGGLIDGDAQVNGDLSVANKSIVNNDAIVRGNLVQGRGTSYYGDAIHSVVMGISAATNKDNVFLWNGNQDEAYTDHDKGTFNINAISGTNGIFIGNQTLEKIVDDKREAARVQAENYTNNVSGQLSIDYVGKIANAKSQAYNEALSDANGYTNEVSGNLSTDYVSKIATAKSEAYNEALSDANGYTNGVSSSLSIDYVGKIADAKEQAITSAANDATEKINALDTTLHDVGTLVSANLDFTYDETSRLITLNIQDYSGHDHTFTIDSARFIKGRIVDHTDIIEIDGKQILRIWWAVAEGGVGVHSDIPLEALAQAYHAGEGITVTLGSDGYAIAVDNTIVNKAFLSGKIGEINADIEAVNGKANTNTAKITSLAEISANHDGRLSALESGLTTANSNIQTNANDIATANSHINGLETYVNSLSVANGQIQTLSNAIDSVSEYAHDRLSSRIELDEGKIDAISAHADRLQAYANILSGGNGHIDTLSDAIDANTADIALANGNIVELQNHTERLQLYANQLSDAGGAINTLSNDIIQLSTNIIDSDTFIGEIKINYNNLTAGTDQAWISQNGNNLSGIIKHFTLAPLGYIKQNTIIRTTFTNVPNNIDRTILATLKYETDDGIQFTDNDYIVIHGEFDQIKLEDITPSNVYYINAVKRNELFELSNTIYNDYAWISGNSVANNHAISGRTDFIADISAGSNISAAGDANIATLTVRNILSANSTNISVDNKEITGVLSGTSETNVATYGQLSAVEASLTEQLNTALGDIETLINNL